MIDNSQLSSSRIRLILVTVLLTTFLVTFAAVYAVGPGSNYPTSEPSVTANQDLGAACGLDVIIVLDASSSISGGEITDIRDGARALLNGLADTGSQAAIVQFSTRASTAIDFTTITSGASGTVENAFEDVITAYPGTQQSTNWDDALNEVNDLLAGHFAPLVVVLTDGDPTAFNTDYDDEYVAPNSTPGVCRINFGGGSYCGGNFNQALWRAMEEANAIKSVAGPDGAKPHILALGISNAPTVANLQKISGPDTSPPSAFNVQTTDVAVIDFDDLEEELAKLATELCKSSITVNKSVWDVDANDFVAAENWAFSATADPIPTEWVAPAAGAVATVMDTTDDAGSLTFQWDPSTPPTDLAIEETFQAGYEFVDVTCSEQPPYAGSSQIVIGPNQDNPVSIDDIAALHSYVCSYRNTPVLLNIDKTGPATATPGGQFTYTITYGNTTTGDGFSSIAYDPVITDDLDLQLTFVSGTAPAPGSCSAVGQLVTCSGMPDLPEGTTAQVTITVEVQDSNYTVVTVPNTACVDADTSNGDPLTQECDDHDVTTPVTVSYFAATSSGSGVAFDWSTATETGNAGFNIYAQTADGPVLVNDDLILSQAVDSGVRLDYSYAADAFGASEFYIEDVGIFDDRRMHGPFALGETYGVRLEADPIDWAAIRAEHQALDAARVASSEQMAVQTTFATNAFSGKMPLTGVLAYPVVELRVSEDGIYRITYEDLEAAGANLLGVRAGYLALSNNGERVPLRYFGRTVQPGFYVEFLGKGLDTLYTDENVYVLQVNRKLRSKMPSNTATVASGAVIADHYLETAAFEGNNAYTYLATNGDPWYDTLLLTNKKSKSWDFTLDADNYVGSAGPAWLNLELWGVNEIEHHVVANVNNEEVANLFFTDRAVETVSVPVGNLHSGANTLVLTAPNDQGAAFDMTVLESYGLTYPRAYVARDGRLSFTALGEAFKVTNLPSKNVVVYFEDESDGPERITKVRRRGSGLYDATFAGAGLGTYYVSAVEALLKPQISLASPATDIASGSADLLIISHANFIPDLAPLVQAREAQGYDVKVVDVNAVYKSYSGGVFDAEAIRLYINHAIKNMGVDYVLLVGADSYNYRGYGGSLSLSFIPSLYTQTSEGVRFAPVDPLYTDVNGDNVPDAAIGRFPVYTPADLALMVEKTLLYENKDYSKSAIFAADKGFGSQSDEFVSVLDGDWSFDEVYLDKTPVGDAKTALVTSLNEGVALASFVGHSGKTHWTFDPLFTSSDAVSLTNYGRPAAVAQWGCWNAYYVDPNYSTLGHKLLLSGTNGAAMVAGSTTITRASSEYKLGKLMMPLLSQPGMTSGEAMLSAKTTLAQSDPELLDVLLGWTILGDPTVKIQP